MGDILGITGSPGTGKKSVAPLVAKKLGVVCLGINDLARSYGLLKESAPEGEVDTGEMRRKLAYGLQEPAVVYGHLLPYVMSPSSVARVAVLRCEPAVLKKRLMARAYPSKKIVDNVEAELIGLVSSDAFDTFGKERTFEVDTTSSTAAVAAESTLEIFKGGGQPGARIDWTTGYDSGAKLRSLLAVEAG